MAGDPIPADEAPVREPTVRLEDLTDGLLWPKLLRAPVLALRPERLLLGVAGVVVMGLLARISRIWNSETPLDELISRGIGDPIRDMAYGVITASPDQIAVGIGALVHAPMVILDADPWAAFALGIPMILVWGVIGVAISRSAACEVALGRVVSWGEAVGFGIAKGISATLAIVGPLALIGVLYLVLAVGGAATLTWPVGDIVGSVLLGLGGLLALIAVVTGIGLALGWVMLVPAIGCEGTDSLDAIQRVYAYVIGRPVRLVIYLVVALAVGAVAHWTVGLVAGGTVDFASSATAQWSGERGAEILAGSSDVALDAVEGEETGWSIAASQGIVGFWRAVVLVLVGGFVVSYIHTAGTLVYLLCRRVNDGQEIAELWTPDAAG